MGFLLLGVSDMAYKVCPKCKKELPATSEYFYKQSRSKDGLTTYCRDCCKAYAREWQKRNSEKERARKKKWRQEHREKEKERKRNQRKLYADKIREYRRKYRELNHERLLLKDREYYLANKLRFRIRDHKREAKKKQLPHTFTPQEWQVCLEFFNYSCAYCGRSEIKLQQDHFIPLSKGGAYVACNIVPACETCNKSKGSTDFWDWYPKQEFYSEEKAALILQYLRSHQQVTS